MNHMCLHRGKIIAAKKCSLTLTLLLCVDLLDLRAVGEKCGLEVPMKSNVEGKTDNKVVKKEDLPATLVLLGLSDGGTYWVL